MKANHILGCIHKNMELNKSIIPFYLAFKRLHLEYCVQFGGSSAEEKYAKWNESSGEPLR